MLVRAVFVCVYVCGGRGAAIQPNAAVRVRQDVPAAGQQHQINVEMLDIIVFRPRVVVVPGAPRSAIAALREITYRSRPRAEATVGVGAAVPGGLVQIEGGGADRCVICLCDFEDGEALKELPCRHMYHTPCIATWLSTRRVRLC